MSAAARARRLSEEAEIIVFERGEHVSFANCGLPYYVGGEIEDRAQLLVQTPGSLAASLNLDVRVRHNVTGFDASAKTVQVETPSEAKRSPTTPSSSPPALSQAVPQSAAWMTRAAFVLSVLSTTPSPYVPP